MRFGATFVFAALTAGTSSQAAPLPICQGGDRAERHVTCIVDGDTGYSRGRKWRLLRIDAPEISHPECTAERRVGLAARDRLADLLGGGYQILKAGRDDIYGRSLVDARLPDGRDAGEVLIAEGLAQPWPNRGNRWCGR